MLAGLEFIEEEFIEPMAESDVADSEDIGSIEVRPDSETENESETESKAVFRKSAFMPSGITLALHNYFHSPSRGSLDKSKKKKT